MNTPAPPTLWRIGTVLTTVSLLLLLPLLTFVLAGLRDEGERIRVRTESAAMNLTQISAHSLVRQLSDTQQFLRTLTARTNVRALDIARCDPVFRDFQKSRPGFTALTTTKPDGTLVCSSLGAIANHPTLGAPLNLPTSGGAPQFQLGRAQNGFLSGFAVRPPSLPLTDDTGGV